MCCIISNVKSACKYLGSSHLWSRISQFLVSTVQWIFDMLINSIYIILSGKKRVGAREDRLEMSTSREPSKRTNVDIHLHLVHIRAI